MACTAESNNENETINVNNQVKEVITKEQELINIENEIKLSPNNHKGYVNRAVYRLNNNELDLAYEDVNRALKIEPEDVETNFTKARVLYNSAKMDMAVAFFERTLKKKLLKIDNQTPWQEIFRNTVGQLEDGACIKSRSQYLDVATKKGIPRNSH